jgi:hypothetical protein
VIKWFILFLATLGACFWGYENMVDSFYESSIHLKTWPKKAYGPLLCQYSPEQVRQVLDQPYTYLGKGRQFFVFASSDGKYVLKFIKCQRIDVSTLYSFLMPKERLQQKQERIDDLFESIHLAACEHAAHTGVLFAHVNLLPEVHKNVELIDKLGINHTINLDNLPFVLQRRAIPVLEAFKTTHDKARLYSQLVELIQADCQAKISDKDCGTILRNNVGFLEDRAIHVDIGTLVHKEVPYEEELSRLKALQ